MTAQSPDRYINVCPDFLLPVFIENPLYLLPVSHPALQERISPAANPLSACWRGYNATFLFTKERNVYLEEIGFLQGDRGGSFSRDTDLPLLLGGNFELRFRQSIAGDFLTVPVVDDFIQIDTELWSITEAAPEIYPGRYPGRKILGVHVRGSIVQNAEQPWGLLDWFAQEARPDYEINPRRRRDYKRRK